MQHFISNISSLEFELKHIIHPNDSEYFGYNEIARKAWEVRKNARLIGKTAVGVAVVTQNGSCFTGCNVEHKFRSHCVHAETNALTTMVANNVENLAQILIVVAERNSFTPCGGCMDWIMELGSPETIVGFQGSIGGPITLYKAKALMPFYPN